MATMFQVSDLAGARRREFLDAAKHDEAALRDTDGSVLVMLTARRVAALTEASSIAVQLFAAEAVLASGDVTPARLGVLAWLAEFDEEDRGEALSELRDALALAVTHHDPEPLREVLHAWQTTAATMRDPLRRAVLSSAPDDEDFAEAAAPVDA